MLDSNVCEIESRQALLPDPAALSLYNKEGCGGGWLRKK